MVQCKNGQQLYAETYDVSVSDWPGEIDFYQEMAQGTLLPDGAVLEIACGTGRIATRLAKDGTHVVGLDHSSEMLEIARQKHPELENIHWVQADMRSFQLDQKFSLAIIPGHSFQFMCTPEDQIACLECVKHHLDDNGVLIIHLDHIGNENTDWLGNLCGKEGGILQPREQFRHPKTGHQIRTSRAWSYEPATHTAIAQTIWEEIQDDGQVVNCWETGPTRLHCVFRFEMEHLLGRVGFSIEAIYGDFFRRELTSDSSELIWVVRNR